LLATEEGMARVLAGMKDTYETRRGRTSMAYVVIANAKEFPQYVGKNLQQIAMMRKLGTANELIRETASDDQSQVTMEDQYRAALDIWSKGGASCVFHSMDEGNVESILRHPLVGVASDSGVREWNVGQPHPRGYGTNARVLGKYVRERKLIPLEEAVRKMTAMPATAFRLSDRGRLLEGFAADVVVFDPATVTDKSTFEQPHAYSEGFDLVIVNGEAVLRGGKMTGGLPGQPIYGPARD
jgi:N-acyl-D-amino-acid deacylase